ncbi:MAG: T9SS type A sorting domain-containing protein [Chlorobi bacterium]|nr:T9SS type A sorting domain-containing protein [Chlorobiota bacterium]
MKNAIFSISAFLIIGIAQAQYYNEWQEPVAITDSISLNSNPAVLTSFEDGNNDVFCFYEKRFSESSPSQIWYRNIYTMTDEQLVLGDDIVEYRNPKVFVYPFSYYNNSRYFLFYESNETGNFDIYGMEVYIDGTFGPSFQMTANDMDNSSFFISHYYNLDISACWKSGNGIQFSNILFSGDTLLFEEIHTIDTNNSYDPVCLMEGGVNRFVAYRKIINDSSKIYFSEFDEIGNTWTEPDTLYATGNNINLNTVGYSYDFPSDNLCWENNGTIMFYDTWQNQTEAIETWVSGNYEPSYITSMIGVKTFYPVILTFCSGEGNNREIYSLGDWGDIHTITDNNYFESNPEIFYERLHYYYFNAVDIWETHKNNKRVLFMSRKSFDLSGGIKDNKSGTNRSIKASPNPFKNELNIEYFLSTNDEASIDIYSINGKPIDHISIDKPHKGWNTNNWEPITNLPNGVYFIVFKNGNEIYAKKVVHK